jgi:hypothetical protein
MVPHSTATRSFLHSNNTLLVSVRQPGMLSMRLMKAIVEEEIQIYKRGICSLPVGQEDSVPIVSSGAARHPRARPHLHDTRARDLTCTTPRARPHLRETSPARGLTRARPHLREASPARAASSASSATCSDALASAALSGRCQGSTRQPHRPQCILTVENQHVQRAHPHRWCRLPNGPSEPGPGQAQARPRPGPGQAQARPADRHSPRIAATFLVMASRSGPAQST